jgi:hypothetical protein
VGHYCRICGRSRPNESFNGGGHRIHVCRECQRLDVKERRAIEALAEISGFLHHQARISRKNVARLEKLAASQAGEVAARAAVMLDVARVAPGKRRRFHRIRSSHPELWERMQAVGLVCSEGSDEWAEHALLDDEGLFREEDENLS